MTHKEKAKYLVYKYYNEMNPDAPDCNISFAQAKQCALIAVDEILKSNPCYEDADRGGNFMWNDNTYYWEQVKHEIEKL